MGPEVTWWAAEPQGATERCECSTTVPRCAKMMSQRFENVSESTTVFWCVVCDSSLMRNLWRLHLSKG